MTGLIEISGQKILREILKKIIIKNLWINELKDHRQLGMIDFLLTSYLAARD